jgi:hypothetical protein
MDPTACFNRLINAILGGHADDAADAAADLAGWIGNGGFTPIGLREADENRVIPGTNIRLRDFRNS